MPWDRIVVGSTADPLVFAMVRSSDRTPAPSGTTPTVYLRKAGGGWAAPEGAVVEVGSGLGRFRVEADADDVDTEGLLYLHAEATDCDDVAAVYHVVGREGESPYRRYSTARPLPFLLLESGSVSVGLAGATPTVELDFGSGFVAATGTVVEVGDSGIGDGLYELQPSSADVADALGPVVLRATDAAAEDATYEFDFAPAAAPELVADPDACGASPFAGAAAVLAAALCRTPVIYERPDLGSIQVCVNPGRKRLLLNDDVEGLRVEYADVDFIFRAADLDFGSGPVRPSRGDFVYWNDGVDLHAFQVLPVGDEPHWRWSDPLHTLIRVHTKRISQEPA